MEAEEPHMAPMRLLGPLRSREGKVGQRATQREARATRRSPRLLSCPLWLPLRAIPGHPVLLCTVTEAPSSPAEWICLSLPVCLPFAVFQPPQASLSVCSSVCTPPPLPHQLSLSSAVSLSLCVWLPSFSLCPWLPSPFARLHLLLALSC